MKEKITLLFIGILWITMWIVVILTQECIWGIWLAVPFAPWYGWTASKYKIFSLTPISYE